MAQYYDAGVLIGRIIGGLCEIHIEGYQAKTERTAHRRYCRVGFSLQSLFRDGGNDMPQFFKRDTPTRIGVFIKLKAHEKIPLWG